MLYDYEGALKDLNKADVLEPNNASILNSRGEVKRMLRDYKEPWKTLTWLMFLNQTMYSI
jgi:hypothetical protein